MRNRKLTRIGAAIALLASGGLSGSPAFAQSDFSELKKATPFVLNGGTWERVQKEFYDYKMPQWTRFAGLAGWNVGDHGNYGQAGSCAVPMNWVLRQSDGAAICGGHAGSNAAPVSDLQIILNKSMKGGALKLEAVRLENIPDVVAYKGIMRNPTSIPQAVRLDLLKSATVSVTKTESTSIGSSVSIENKIEPEFLGIKGGSFAITLQVSTNTSWSEAKATVESLTAGVSPTVNLPPFSSVDVLITLKRGKVTVPYTLDAELSWQAAINGCLAPWTRGQGLVNNNSELYTDDWCRDEGSALIWSKNGGALKPGIGADYKDDLLNQYEQRFTLPYQRPSSTINFANLQKYHATTHDKWGRGAVLHQALVNYHWPVRAQVKGNLSFDAAFEAAVVFGKPTKYVPPASQQIEKDPKTGVTLHMSSDAADKLRAMGGVTFGQALPSSINWQQLPGGLRVISTDGKLTCGLTNKDEIFCSDNGNAMKPDWFRVDGSVQQLTVSNGRIYGVGWSRDLWYHPNPRSGDWVKLNGAGDHISHNSKTGELCRTYNGVPYCGKHDGSSSNVAWWQLRGGGCEQSQQMAN